MRTWLERDVRLKVDDIGAVSGDASFRSYYRVATAQASYIAMDAPPGREDPHPFIDVTHRLEAAGLNVPKIVEADIVQGFLLLSDLGDELYLQHLDETNADALYGDALEALFKLQGLDAGGLPRYDHDLLWREMELFREWFLQHHLGIALDASQQAALVEAFETLAGEALAQPRVFVHRDYHARNLLLSKANNPGILDYQDAVAGPVTYDLVSLVRDCYIAWPEARLDAWIERHRQRLSAAGRLQRLDSSEDFRRAVDLMGIQRHLKAIGIFARLNHRDGKPGYLADIPRTLGYVTEVSARHPETAGLHALVQQLGLVGQVAS